MSQTAPGSLLDSKCWTNLSHSLQESGRSMDPSQHHQAGAQLDPRPIAHLGPALPYIRVSGWRGRRPGAHCRKHIEGSHLPHGSSPDAQLQEERRGDFGNPLHLLACCNGLWSSHIQVEKQTGVKCRATGVAKKPVVVLVKISWLLFSRKVPCCWSAILCWSGQLVLSSSSSAGTHVLNCLIYHKTSFPQFPLLFAMLFLNFFADAQPKYVDLEGIVYFSCIIYCTHYLFQCKQKISLQRCLPPSHPRWHFPGSQI